MYIYQLQRCLRVSACASHVISAVQDRGWAGSHTELSISARCCTTPCGCASSGGVALFYSGLWWRHVQSSNQTTGIFRPCISQRKALNPIPSYQTLSTVHSFNNSFFKKELIKYFMLKSHQLQYCKVFYMLLYYELLLCRKTICIL